MSLESNKIDDLAINTIRFLSADGVQKANSGHPGMPMGCAPIAYVLYEKVMKHNPSNPKWFNRDRFVLSAGHGSMLLYSILHLSGYNISLDDIKQFRQWGSITPGHPENKVTPGVETTTGPLGQGIANAVGLALAEAHLAACFNKDDIKLVDNYVFGICGDGDLMEGVSHEAASLAGHLKLGKLIFFYDNNGITIDGKASLSCTDDVRKRFEAYGWQVLHIVDANDVNSILSAVKEAKSVSDKPTLIVTDTHIGYGSPNKQDLSSSHGSPLGVEEVKLAKKNLGWDPEKLFYIPEEVKELFEHVLPDGINRENEWKKLYSEYTKKYPQEAAEYEKIMSGNYGDEWIKNLPVFTSDMKPIATRAASGKVINSIAKFIPGLIGGSADLAGSNNTQMKDYGDVLPGDYAGRNLHFGIREHGMAAILNGMALYAGLVPYGATFLIFSDYLRPSLRIGSLSQVRPIYIFTHDSIGLGEDGPTHQPVEQLAALRAIPEVIVIRPCDANETSYAWKTAVQHKGSPVALILTRQNLPILNRNIYNEASNLEKGAYILKDCAGTPDLILMASGSEVHLALEAGELLKEEKVNVRIVSFPSWELFEKQSPEYKESVLPENVAAKISIEAGIKMGWEKYTGSKGTSISIETFGASAPDKVLFEKYGFTAQNVFNKAKALLETINQD